MGVCSVENCGRETTARGLCQKHYWKLRRSELRTTTCSVAGCDKPQFCKQLCRGHYARVRRGKPLDAPIQDRLPGNCTVACRISAEAMALLEKHAAATGMTVSRIAGKMLTRELGLREE